MCSEFTTLLVYDVDQLRMCDALTAVCQNITDNVLYDGLNNIHYLNRAECLSNVW